MKELIKQYDKLHLFDLLKQAPENIEHVLKNFPRIEKFKGIKQIIIGGMGGSAISGIIARSFMEKFLKIPIIIYSEENINIDCEKDTLFIGISYSGTTKETLNMLKKCKKALIYGISTNPDFTRNTIIIPSGLPPRFGFYYLFSSLILLLSRGFGKRSLEKYLKNSIEPLKRLIKRFLKESSLPFEMALSAKNKPLLIYAPSYLKGVAYRYKTQFNENSKHFAFYNYFPEFCHNEIVPFITGKNNFSVILLRSFMETDIEAKEMNFFGDFVDFEVEFQSENVIEEILKFVLLGDFTSYYLAIIKKLDPYDIELINKLKESLNKK